MSTVVETPKLPVDDILLPAEMLRKVNVDSQGFVELRDDMDARGLLQPIAVRESEDGPVLVEGGHRLAAAKELGWKEIEVHFVTADDANALLASIAGNAHRIDTKPVEYSKAIQRILLANPTITRREIARQLNKSTGWVDNILKLQKLDAEVVPVVETGDVVLMNAVSLSKLPAEEQADFLERAKTQKVEEFVQTVNARLEEIRKARQEGKNAEEEGFTPKQFARSKSEIQAELESMDTGDKVLADISDPVEAYKEGLLFCLNCDRLSVEKQRVEYEEHKAKKAEEREESKAKRSVKTKRQKERTDFEISLLREGLSSEQVDQKLREFDEETDRQVEEELKKVQEEG